MSLHVQLKTVRSGLDGATCWINPMVAVFPETPGRAILISQKLLLSHSDRFYGLHMAESFDHGENWNTLQPIPALANRVTNTGEIAIAGMKIDYHSDSGKVLGIGCDCAYTHNYRVDIAYRRSIVHTVFDPVCNAWSPPLKLELPAPFDATQIMSINAQRERTVDGDLLVPAQTLLSSSSASFSGRYAAVIIRCSFDGETLTYRGHGDILSTETTRGLFEPSLLFHSNHYWLTLRNDESGYVTRGETPYHFAPIKRWTFDDGEWLGNYNTQQHWLTLGENLYLVYTRKGLGNDHVFRHRAPLLIGKVDPETLTVIRATERIVIPERGARLGNFGVTRISPNESWVTVAEWMQPVGCEKYGCDNSVYVAKITE